MKYKTNKQLKSLTPAIARLQEFSEEYRALTPEQKQNYGVLARDGVLQMFLVGTNIMMCALRAYLLDQGNKVPVNPYKIFDMSQKYGLIQEQPAYLAMLDDSRRVLQTYDEAGMERLYKKIEAEYLGLLKKTLNALIRAK